MSATDADGEFELLLAVDIGISDFASNWAYCDRLSSYVARMVSHNRTDSLLYSNLFSSALNELLETAFRAHGSSGNLICRVLRRGGTDRIELTIPCDDDGGTFFRDTVSRLGSAGIEDDYRQALFAEGPVDPAIGLLELAVDYDARLSVETVDGDAVRLTADFALEDTEV